MTSKAAKTHPATRFFIMAATPRRRRTSHDAEADLPSLAVQRARSGSERARERRQNRKSLYPTQSIGLLIQ
jgi:hypothetical protein